MSFAVASPTPRARESRDTTLCAIRMCRGATTFQRTPWIRKLMSSLSVEKPIRPTSASRHLWSLYSALKSSGRNRPSDDWRRMTPLRGKEDPSGSRRLLKAFGPSATNSGLGRAEDPCR